MKRVTTQQGKTLGWLWRWWYFGVRWAGTDMGADPATADSLNKPPHAVGRLNGVWSVAALRGMTETGSVVVEQDGEQQFLFGCVRIG